MQKFKITLLKIHDKNEEETAVLEWKTIPQKGEFVELGDAHHRVRYVVLNVVHCFGRGIDSQYGEIMLEVTQKF